MRPGYTLEMTDKKLTVPVLELRRLLTQIKDRRPDICVRFRRIGEMWQPNMMRVVTVTDTRVMVNDEQNNRLISIAFSTIMQFEIDDRLYDYDRHFHYHVKLD
jgi:hypothetical protein